MRFIASLVFFMFFESFLALVVRKPQGPADDGDELATPPAHVEQQQATTAADITENGDVKDLDEDNHQPAHGDIDAETMLEQTKAKQEQEEWQARARGKKGTKNVGKKCDKTGHIGCHWVKEYCCSK